jgi:hypothetical protein
MPSETKSYSPSLAQGLACAGTQKAFPTADKTINAPTQADSLQKAREATTNRSMCNSPAKKGSHEKSQIKHFGIVPNRRQPAGIPWREHPRWNSPAGHGLEPAVADDLKPRGSC